MTVMGLAQNFHLSHLLYKILELFHDTEKWGKTFVVTHSLVGKQL